MPFESIESSMRKWRRKICPPIPAIWEQYSELVNSEEWKRFTTYNGGHLNVTSIRVPDDNSTVVICIHREFLRSIKPRRLYVDATFKVCPSEPKVLQLLTIIARIGDYVLPIAWAMMKKKTKAAYLAVLNHFSTVLAPHIQPLSFMTDFERALAAALQEVYPEATPERCYFHYCQCLMRRGKKTDLLNHVRNCEMKKVVFRKMMALALLPANDIPRAFNWIISNVCADIARAFADLFQYFERYWLNSVTPEVFSVFGMPCKTNNCVEAYHRVLRRCWELYVEKYLDIPRLLARASHCLKAFGNENVFRSDQDVDNFVLANPVDGVQAEDMQAMFEEEVDEIQILYRQEGQYREIIFPQGVILQLCIICNDNHMDVISLPCCYWFACAMCAINIRELALAERADIRCAKCHTELHRITVTAE